MNFDTFLEWEQATNDILDFKKVYVDMAGSINAGLMLSHIVYWYLPNAQGETKLRVYRNGHHWIACRRYEWWERIRLNIKQADSALKALEQRGLIKKQTFKFNGEPTVHVRLVKAVFVRHWQQALHFPPQNPNLPKQDKSNSSNGINHHAVEEEVIYLDEEGPYTEGTTESTADTTPKEEEQSYRAEKSEISNSDLDRAIQEVWSTTAPGRIDELKQTLLGFHPRRSEHYRSNITPPTTPDELYELADFYKRTNPDHKLPTTPAKIQDWIYRLRNRVKTRVVRQGYSIAVNIRVPKESASSDSTINAFIGKYYPEEDERINAVLEELKLREVPKQKFQPHPTLHYAGHSYEIPVPIPVEVWKAGTDAIHAYFSENYPEQYAEMNEFFHPVGLEVDEAADEVEARVAKRKKRKMRGGGSK